MRLPRPSDRAVAGVCLAAVVANTVIVLTGALVRLTGSGLGCPTWPRCTGASYVTTRESGVHGLIEFGNRTLTGPLAVVVAACLVMALLQRPRRPALVRLAGALVAGIVGQAVLGGITVRTHLNPWTVAGHFLLSMAMLAAAITLYVRARESDTPPRPVVRPQLRRLVAGLVAVTGAVLVLGTVVTGSGPHAGDSRAARTGFDPQTVSQLHADAVMLLVGLTVATLVALAATGAPGPVRRAAAALLGVELAQGLVGYVQYFTGLPVALVAAHVLGACLVWLAAWRLLLATRTRSRAAVTDPAETSAGRLAGV